ncbi:MAG: uracil phosphoribosyltransferase [Muribaculaceae bacterium]|nr:uracil phosphoribosyltransferase [Muribaculaceae bacterium]MCI9054749.1 uracil phosphoribosyltransferase [Muribaculaceae bacterium]
MKVVNFDETPSLMSRYLLEMRSVDMQRDPLRFRRNLERAGEIMAYEISKTMKYKKVEVQTPLDVATCDALDEKVVLGTIFRAGVPFHQGFLSYFDSAENAFVSAYRKYKEKENFDILIEYLASPRLEGKTLILCDPMLATGASMELSYRALLTKGTPARVHLASVIASRQAVEYLEKLMPEDATLWVGVIDDHINAHSYIVPGLGDAGDLAYGTKE